MAHLERVTVAGGLTLLVLAWSGCPPMASWPCSRPCACIRSLTLATVQIAMLAEPDWADPDVRLHAKVPRAALLVLVQLRVALADAVLGRSRCGDDGRIHDRAGLEHQPVLSPARVDDASHLRGAVPSLRADAGFAEPCARQACARRRRSRQSGGRAAAREALRRSQVARLPPHR